MNKAAAPPSRISTLRQRLVDARDFSVPWNYFHDQVVAEPSFRLLGVPAPNERIAGALEAAASHALREPAKVRELSLIHVPDESFWHGYVEFNGPVGIFFYFDEPAVGLLGLSQSFDKPDIFLVRVSVAKTAGEGVLFPGRRGQA